VLVPKKLGRQLTNFSLAGMAAQVIWQKASNTVKREMRRFTDRAAMQSGRIASRDLRRKDWDL
jgi:hypothetical protein